MLTVIETHPVQYHAPVYRALQQRYGVPVTAVYGSDFSVAGARDREFGVPVAWDTDLLSGYSSVFLSRTSDGGADRYDTVSTAGLRGALARIDASAVLLVGYSPRFYRRAWFEARRTGRPILFRAETSDHARGRGWLKDGLRRAALGLAYRSCDRVMYIGVRARQHFERHGVPADRLVFSPYCVDTAPFRMDDESRARLRASTRRQFGVSDDRLVVLYAGKLSHRKGVDLIVEAARRLPAALRDRLALVFLGDGDQRSDLEARAAASPAVTAIFAGFQNQTKLSPYYHAADLLVLPSRHSETWGLVVNEALHHGLPCVVSDRVGCAPDLIVPDETGYVFESGSISSVADAIERGLELSSRAGVRAACRTRVQGYTVERAAEGIALAYAAVAPGGRAVMRAS